MARSPRVRLTKQELSFVISKPEMCLIICTECWCATDELVEFWSVEINIFVEHGQKLVKSRGIDLGHKALQVFADSFKPKGSESGDEPGSRTMGKLTHTNLQGSATSSRG